MSGVGYASPTYLGGGGEPVDKMLDYLEDHLLWDLLKRVANSSRPGSRELGPDADDSHRCLPSEALTVSRIPSDPPSPHPLPEESTHPAPDPWAEDDLDVARADELDD